MSLSSVEKRIYCLMLRIYVTSIRQQVTSTWCRSYDYSNLEPKLTKGYHYPTYKTIYNYIAHSTPSLTKTILQSQRANTRNRSYLNCIYLRQKRYIKVTNTNPLHNYTMQRTARRLNSSLPNSQVLLRRTVAI
jgi:hypothetical protein